MKRVVFKIQGMDCAEEVAVRRRAVGPVIGGADHLSCDILHGTMTVFLPEEIDNADAVVQAVRRTGMHASLCQDVAPLADDHVGGTSWQRWERTGLCLLSGIVWQALSQGSWLVALTGGAVSGASPLPFASRLFYLGAMVSGAWHVVPKALYAVRSLRPDMHVLMLVAVGGAIALGEWCEAATVAFLFALALSTPVSVVAGLTAAARVGVLIKGGASLEAPARLRAIAFDKTGTLTYGQPIVQEIIPLNGHTIQELLTCAAALEAHSAHPLARAILQKAASLGLTTPPAEHFTALQGRGAEAVIQGKRFWIGSHRLMEDLGIEDAAFHELATSLEDAGHSLVAISTEEHICGLISVADGIRAVAAEVVRALKRLGIAAVVMLTGDNQGTAQAVAAAIGVDQVRAELLPADKVKVIEELRHTYGDIAMVGDGVNDAPAMAAATLGIAMGGIGTAAAMETADITLMSDDLTRLTWLVRHARRTLRVTKQNILCALGLKLVFIILAVAGVATLWMAIAADMGASLLVIFNSLRLMKQ